MLVEIRAAEGGDDAKNLVRGDKRRTIRMQDGIVKDHLSGQTWEINSYLSGKW